jgi:hypothetical protein
MRKTLIVLALIAIAVPLFAKDKNKDWQSGKILEVKTQDMQNADYNNPNSATGQGHAPIAPGDATRGPTGGSFSSAPVHFVIYNIALETGEEVILAKLSREASYRPPDLKVGTDVKWKSSGPKFVEIMDSSGKKFEFQVTRRDKKPEQSATPAK